MINFILNDEEVNTGLPLGMTVLDFIRYERRLTGTKIGCREGDCGACTVLVGELKNNVLTYRSVTSCLMPIGNASGKHIVSIEGINFPGLNPVQQAMSDHGATQCGFCTPGFIMSLTGFCMQDKNEDVIASIDGNICRCTGYKSIEKAAHSIEEKIKNRGKEAVLDFAIKNGFLPEYFNTIKDRLALLLKKSEETEKNLFSINTVYVGGGTDLYVQKHEEMVHYNSDYLAGISSLTGISQENNHCILGASSTATDLIESDIIRKAFPNFLKYSKLVSSTPIRNMATLGGNFVNASPIGDFTIFFLALEAKIKLKGANALREISLRDFYLGYKKLDKLPDEIVSTISFELPDENTFFNFEKVSKRTNLDIASSNSAIKLTVRNNTISKATISAGGVGPIPMVLKKTSEFLSGKIINEMNIDKACTVVDEDIAPISDARGSDVYKRFLLKQLIRAHFITLFPNLQPQKFQIAYEEH